MINKIIIAAILILGNINAQEIEGRWNPGGFGNTMYEFMGGLRYTYYCADENGCDTDYWDLLDTSDAIPNPNPYWVNGNTISIDLHFGNTATYTMDFRCDGEVVDFYYDEDDDWEGLHSSMFRLRFDYANSDCDICSNYDEVYCSWMPECQWEDSDNMPGDGLCVEIETDNCSDINDQESCESNGCDWIESDNVPGGGSCVEIETDNCSDMNDQEECESYGCIWNESDNLPGGGGCFDRLAGDVNLDDTRNVLDVVLIVGFILNTTNPSDSEFQASDMNFDGELNVLDVVSLVNSILGLSRFDYHIESKAILDENTLNLEGSIGGIQFIGTLISNLNGDDIIASNNGKSIIYNLNGILETKVFTFEKEPNDLIVSSSSAHIVNVESIKVSTFKLNPAYPNPFNPSTTLSYSIEKDISINISIYNMEGQKVSELVNANQIAGNYSVTWDASNKPSGLYFVKLSAGNQISSQKIMLVK